MKTLIFPYRCFCAQIWKILGCSLESEYIKVYGGGAGIEVPVSRAFLGEQEGFFFRKVYLLLTRDGVLVFQPGKDPPTPRAK